MPVVKAKPRHAAASPKPAPIDPKVKRTTTVRAKTRTEPVSSDISMDLVAERAYFHWLKRGCPEGSPQEDWLRAEQELGLRA